MGNIYSKTIVFKSIFEIKLHIRSFRKGNIMNASNKSKSRYIYVLGIILFGIISIIGLIIYSHLNSGDFIFSNDSPESSVSSITLADNMGFTSASPRLITESVKLDEISIAYDSIKLEEILQSQGQYIDPDQKYIAYSFYIRDIGNKTITIDYFMRITEVYYSMSEYVRILIIVDDVDYRMYQKADQPDENNNMPSYNQMPVGIDFMTDNIVFRDAFYNFRPDEVKCFRVIIWVEGQDPDVNQNDQIGRFETEMNFSIRADNQVSSNQIDLLSSEDKNIWTPITNLCTIVFVIYY